MAASQHAVILFAQHEVMPRNQIRSVLQHEGYDVLAAADGSEALELFRAHAGTIDLLLTTVELPAVDGISAYRQISTERPNMKVLFLSGKGTLSALALPNAWPSIATPFPLDILLAKVTEVLDECPPMTGKHLNVILVVDHDKDRRDRTSKILTENGYAVLTANSVEQAEPRADTIATIDLIISGIVFPGHSGIHLAEHVEASQRKVSTLLISHFDRDLLRKMPGFSRQPEFLPNPFTPEALLTRVRRLLDALP